MSKKVFFLLFLSFFLLFAPLVVSAQKPEDWEPPEKSGVYDVPGKPGMKVRVFVHPDKGKPPKPEPTPSPVFNCTDNDSTSVIGLAGWHLPENWAYYVNPSVPSSISSSLSTIVEKSFNAWRAPLSGKVSFRDAGTTGISVKKLDGKNIIAWGRTSGSALGVTYTWYYPSTGLAVETDTIMNKKFSWSWTDPNAFQCSQNANTYDAQNILTHELGHWVGLSDKYTSDYVDNTMYGYGSKGEIKKDTLTSGDVAGLTTLY